MNSLSRGGVWRKAAITLFLLNVAALFVAAQQGYDLVMAIASPAGRIICSIYGAFVMISGALASLVIVYAGIKWIASGEDPAQRKVAKSMITHAILALIIILVSDSIVSMVTEGQLEGCEGIMNFFGGPGSACPTGTTGYAVSGLDGCPVAENVAGTICFTGNCDCVSLNNCNMMCPGGTQTGSGVLQGEDCFLGGTITVTAVCCDT